jgi:hypothetical protein
VSTENAVPGPVVRVAEQLELLAGANAEMALELDQISRGGRALSQATVERLAALVDRLRPAAAARTSLAGLDQAMLLAGVREWQRRAGARR